MTLQIHNLLDQGPIPYRVAWERQKELVAARQRGEASDTLLLLEHAPTVTYGHRADRAHLRLTPQEYATRNITLVETDRGGDVTYHGPGQLVGYPILHLGEGRRDVHRYVRALEEVILRAVSDLGVRGAGRAPWHAGVWVGEAYLAALGIRVSRWVTYHGFALNVGDEVFNGFETIVPCGVAGKPVTSVSSLLGRDISLAQAGEAVARQFVQQFENAEAAGPIDHKQSQG